MIRFFARFGFYLLIALLLSYPTYRTIKRSREGVPAFGLLIPKSEAKSNAVKVWTQAASEEGVPLSIFYEEDFAGTFGVFSGSQNSVKALIVPDEISKVQYPAVIARLREYVEGGGKLALIADAFAYEQNGRLSESLPAETLFHFPKILDHQGDTLPYREGPIWVPDASKDILLFPPGKLNATDDKLFIETYQSSQTPYPHWKTESVNTFKGKVLLKDTEESLVAGVSKMGKGEVLWVNLPLGYLKRRTDGFLLHSFIRYISETWAGLPRLLSVPNGVGGLVLNLHVDSNAAIESLGTLQSEGIFDQGPFSIHITAGPDAREVGDGLGFNLAESEESQAWVHKWTNQGHEVGSHGGWIHDYFGHKLSDKPNDEMKHYIELNTEAISKFSEKRSEVYSAPIGNQPAWVTHTLVDLGYKAYYFTGNTGLGPTRTFRDDDFTDEKIWSFPIHSFGRIASFEEAGEAGISENKIETWLNELSTYVSKNSVVRLFYFHPPGALDYLKTLKNWLKFDIKLKKKGLFNWYTMKGLAAFLNERESVQWQIDSPTRSQFEFLKVSSHARLSEMVFQFKKRSTHDLKLIEGEVTLIDKGDLIWVASKNDSGFVMRFEETRKHEVE